MDAAARTESSRMIARLSGGARETKRTRTATAPSFGSEAMNPAVSFEAPW